MRAFGRSAAAALVRPDRREERLALQLQELCGRILRWEFHEPLVEDLRSKMRRDVAVLPRHPSRMRASERLAVLGKAADRLLLFERARGAVMDVVSKESIAEGAVVLRE